MKELLSKLKKVDPITWTEIDFAIDIEDETYNTKKYDLHTIQGCIQDAMLKKGWYPNLHMYPWKIEAYVFITRYSNGEELKEKAYFAADGDSPAEALLKTYLLAMESL